MLNAQFSILDSQFVQLNAQLPNLSSPSTLHDSRLSILHSPYSISRFIQDRNSSRFTILDSPLYILHFFARGSFVSEPNLSFLLLYSCECLSSPRTHHNSPFSIIDCRFLIVDSRFSICPTRCPVYPTSPLPLLFTILDSRFPVHHSPFLAQDRFGVNKPGHHPAGAAVAGAAATVFHDAIMTPMDVIKQRLQLGYHKGMLDCVMTIRRTEGAQVGGWVGVLLCVCFFSFFRVLCFRASMCLLACFACLAWFVACLLACALLACVSFACLRALCLLALLAGLAWLALVACLRVCCEK